jgi:hypothetical protein
MVVRSSIRRDTATETSDTLATGPLQLANHLLSTDPKPVSTTTQGLASRCLSYEETRLGPQYRLPLIWLAADAHCLHLQCRIRPARQSLQIYRSLTGNLSAGRIILVLNADLNQQVYAPRVRVHLIILAPSIMINNRVHRNTRALIYRKWKILR